MSKNGLMTWLSHISSGSNGVSIIFTIAHGSTAMPSLMRPATISLDVLLPENALVYISMRSTRTSLPRPISMIMPKEPRGSIAPTSPIAS